MGFISEKIMWEDKSTKFLISCHKSYKQMFDDNRKTKISVWGRIAEEFEVKLKVKVSYIQIKNKWQKLEKKN